MYKTGSMSVPWRVYATHLVLQSMLTKAAIVLTSLSHNMFTYPYAWCLIVPSVTSFWRVQSLRYCHV